MFEIFEANYALDSVEPKGVFGEGLVPDLPGLAQFFEDYGGASFENGLYRIIRPVDLIRWQERIELAFPEFADRAVCFAYDWAGNVFALNIERLEDGKAGVTLFEPGIGEVLQIPSNLQTFHENGLIEFGEAALNIDFYKKWQATGGKAPAYDQCVGYRKPLFLSGVDEVENLEISDLDVYWHIMGQLIHKTRGLPPGTSVHLDLD
jgi:hypothetical protein